MDKLRPGVNFTTDADGNLIEGFHLETFYNYFKPKVNRGGWVNLRIKKLDQPTEKGYTHGFELVIPESKSKAA